MFLFLLITYILQEIIKSLPTNLKVVDLSAVGIQFRLDTFVVLKIVSLLCISYIFYIYCCHDGHVGLQIARYS